MIDTQVDPASLSGKTNFSIDLSFFPRTLFSKHCSMINEYAIVG